jgi:hypothetical protein
VILFLDEDRAYLNWTAHHRAGFVLDCLRHPIKAHLVLHRATCPEIKHAASKRTHWTTGKHMKACSLDVEQLKAWSSDQAGHEPNDCPQCTPQQEIEVEIHLTKLDRHILDYVLEIASIHVDGTDYDYSLTVGMVARCFGKTEGQLMSALRRLVDDELLAITGKAKHGDMLPSHCGVLPTVKAFRTIAAYAEMDDEQIQLELRKLIREE